tara:strand:+ start:145 stop:327 length:183 start_codon:yes stop_codon:yes gene_type:complete
MKIQFYQHQIDNLVNHLKTELDYDVYPMTSKKDLEEILNVIMFGNKFMISEILKREKSNT